MKRAFHFLGSVHFAVTLIGFTALFVIAGTLLESITESHKYAALYTYRHPAFITLLSLFFINILFAALRRWPFKRRHFPFLITHLGLLMLIAGTIIKQTHGIQGNMTLIEGSGSHELLLSDTSTVAIQKKEPRYTQFYDLYQKQSPFPELNIELLGYAPHCEETIETWFKGNRCVISGLPPLPIAQRSKVDLFPNDPWNLFTLRTTNTSEEIEKLYYANTKMKITDRITNEVLYESVLKDATINNSSLVIHYKESTIEIPLNGEEALLNQNLKTPYLGHGTISVDLITEPTLIFLQDHFGDTTLAAFDPHGRIWTQHFPKETLKTLVVYEDGFGGYAAMATLPFSQNEGGRKKKEERIYHTLEKGLAQFDHHPENLAPPVRLFHEACQKESLVFSKTFVDFLKHWDAVNFWIIPSTLSLPRDVSQAIQAIDWASLPQKEKNGCLWCTQFFEKIDPDLQKGGDPVTLLKKHQWPLPLQTKDNGALLTDVTRQLFSAANELPDDQQVSSASLLSAYLRAYGIHLSTITPPPEPVQTDSGITLETPLTLQLKRAPSLKKLEDNTPFITLKFQEEIIALPFDKSGSNLKWPILEGNYLVRFQPQSLEIPFHLRLRQARQVNYPHSGQAFSYEADLLITDRQNGKVTEKTISMNHVHETPNGYRFYLSSMTPSDESAVKRVQLIVNYDPAKYLLTYPGAVIMTLGIVLLFWFKNR